MFLSPLLSFAAVSGEPTETAFRQAIARNAAYRRDQFIAAGLMPIEEAAKKRRDVRRLLVSVWLPGRPPMMEIERHKGSVTLLLAWKDKPAERHSLPASVWRELTSLDKSVFAKPVYDLDRIGRRPAGVVSCHGDTAEFEATINRRVRTAGAGQCFPRYESFNAAKLSAIAIFTRAAIGTRPNCTFDSSRPADSFANCFR